MRFHGLGIRAATILACSSALGVCGTVKAGVPQSHLCPADSAPPPMAAPGDRVFSATQSGPEPSPKPAPRSDDEPTQFMGCLKRDYAFFAVETPLAQQAVVIADEPGSTAAIFRYDTPAQRDALIDGWLRRHAQGDFVPTKPMTLYIADWANVSWRLPERVVVHVMFPEKAHSGQLCLVRADTPKLREALPALNDWCMDVLGLWSD